MKNFLLLIALCLLASGCKDENVPKEEIPEEIIPEEETPPCDECACPEWVGKEFKNYAQQTPPSLPMLYYLENDGVLYYAIIDGYASNRTASLRLFQPDGTEIKENQKDYGALRNLFSEGKFRYNISCTIKYLEIPEEETIPGCDDCPCPEWLDREFKYYRGEIQPIVGMLFYMEKDNIPYYAINNVASSCVTCQLRFFEADGTEIEEHHEDYNVLQLLFVKGKFRYNHPCTQKYLEKY